MEKNSITESVWVKKGIVATLLVLTLFLFASSLNEFSNYGNNPQIMNTITVSGKGEVLAIPDIATFNFSIIEEAPTVAEANQKAAEKNNAAIDLLRSKGIEDKDITATPNFNPKYEYSRQPCTQWSCPSSNPSVVGYEVSYFVTVKVREADKTADIVTGLGELEVKNLSNVSYTIDDDEDLRMEARTNAIEDAKSKAKKLADDLGVKLKGVVSFSENGEGGYPVPMYMKSMEASVSSRDTVTPDLPKGQNTITSNVNVTFRIK